MILNKGSISLSKDYFTSSEGIEILKEVFLTLGFVTLYIEEKFNSKEYFGYSSKFKPIEEGQNPTRYDVIIQHWGIVNNNNVLIDIKEVE